MKNSFRSGLSHLASQPKLLALAAVIAVGTNLATGLPQDMRGQVFPPSPITLTNPIIVDDGDAGFTASSVVSHPTGYAGDNRTVVPNMWAFNAPVAGIYDVYATWIATPANSTATSYVIMHRMNTTSTSLPRTFVNQTFSPDDAVYQDSNWEKIGSVNLSTPALMSVLGATEQNAYVDAVAFVLRTQCADSLDNDGDGKVDFPMDPGCANAADNSELSLRIANLTITKTGPASVQRGNTVMYTVSVVNSGPDSAVGLEVLDDVPAGLIFNDAASSNLCDLANGTVICKQQELGKNQTLNLTLVFTAPLSTSCQAQEISNWAEVQTTTSVDNDEDDNISASVSTTLTCPVPWSAAGVNLFVSQPTSYPNYKQLLGGTLSEPINIITLSAKGEAIRVKRLALRSTFSLAPIDRLELSLPNTTVPIVILRPDGCAGSVPDTLCADISDDQLIVPLNGVVTLNARAFIKPDTQGQYSGQLVQVIIKHLAGIQEVIAEGKTSLGVLRENDGDAIAEGEIFFGRQVNTYGPNQLRGAQLHKIVNSKIASIANANPDPNFTTIPTGIAPFGQFVFTAATNSNIANGTNRFTMRKLKITVSAYNVHLRKSSFRLYNKSDPTIKIGCTTGASSPNLGVDIVTSQFDVLCDLVSNSSLQVSLESGAQQTLVLEGDVIIPQTPQPVQRSLKAYLGSWYSVIIDYNIPTMGYGFGSIEWTDSDSSTAQQFGWIDFKPYVYSTDYRRNY